jgi:hypothetical protein
MNIYYAGSQSFASEAAMDILRPHRIEEKIRVHVNKSQYYTNFVQTFDQNRIFGHFWLISKNSRGRSKLASSFFLSRRNIRECAE